MKTIINAFTMGHPKQMIGPALCHFFEGLTISFPAVAVYFAINLLAEGFANPASLNMHTLRIICIVMGGLFAVQLFVSWGSFLGTFLPAATHSAENKTDFVYKLKTLPLGYFSKKAAGELINTFTSDFLALEQSMVALFTGLAGVVFSCIITSLFMFYFNPQMAFAFYMTMPVAALIIVLSLKTFGKLDSAAKSAKDAAADSLNEYLFGMKVLRSYNQTGQGFTRLSNAYRDVRDTALKGEITGGTLLSLAITCIRLGLPLMCFTGAYLIQGGRFALVDYLSLIIVGTKIVSPLLVWMRYIALLRVHYVSASRIGAVMKQEPLPGTVEHFAVDDIVFKNVGFSYVKGSGNAVLKDVSFTIPKGKLTAIVGPSGSGKSTIIRLLARFWEADTGTILCGDTPIKTIDNEKWLAAVSMVLQEVYLFHETIRENILFGRKDASEEQMIEAAKKANCHDFIMKLPQGYDTVAGEGGSTLSGGEKQRIAIARALLKDAPLLLLDEPTASLDARNEVAVQKAIGQLVRNKTVIMIAHRLKTVEHADQILVVNEGRIEETGTHRELLERNGLYARLWNLQNRSKEWSLG